MSTHPPAPPPSPLDVGPPLEAPTLETAVGTILGLCESMGAGEPPPHVLAALGLVADAANALRAMSLLHELGAVERSPTARAVRFSRLALRDLAIGSSEGSITVGSNALHAMVVIAVHEGVRASEQAAQRAYGTFDDEERRHVATLTARVVASYTGTHVEPSTLLSAMSAVNEPWNWQVDRDSDVVALEPDPDRKAAVFVRLLGREGLGLDGLRVATLYQCLKTTAPHMLAWERSWDYAGT